MAPSPPSPRRKTRCAPRSPPNALCSQETWADPPGPLRVRMALHAGEAVPDDRGDYLAAPLNRLSRLLSIGHGGQILLSQAVQQLISWRIAAGTELRDLGEHRLRDLLEPERVFQLLHPDLPQDFPPLQSLDARPNNLPDNPRHSWVARCRSGRSSALAAAGGRAAPDADRARRHRQDPARPAGCGGAAR